MKIILWLSLMALRLCSYSQNQGNIWYFGEGAGLDFNTEEPTPLTDGQIFAAPQNFNEGLNNEGSSVISNDLGEFLFYTNGETIWNRNHDIMPNGEDLMGMYSSTQSSLIIPRPESDSLFYVFTTDGLERNLEDGFRYSVVDMCLDDGLGDVKPDEKNIQLIDVASEKIAAVQHANGIDIWIVAHRYNDDDYHAYLLTENGLSAPVITEIGSVHQGNGFFAGIGQMKISSDGTQLAMVYSNVNPSAIELFDFDNSTGILSNFKDLDSSFNEYGLEFSPDGTKLYVTSLTGIHQFDLTAGGGTEAEINASKLSLTSAACAPSGMQLAPNGKIYISRCNNYLACVQEPNNAGLACSFNEVEITLGQGLFNVSLPNFLSGYTYSNSSYSCDDPDCVDTIVLPCDDNDDCTINDEITVDALDNSIVCIPCSGTPEANCDFTEILPCDDGDPCTINDQITVSSCDNDLVCIPCAGTFEADCTETIALPCDDGNSCTSGDIQLVSACDATVTCEPCAGIFEASCENTIVLPCDDKDSCTINDEITVSACDIDFICIPCAGTIEANCENTVTLPCDDGNDCTINDQVTVSACDNDLICIPCAGEDELPCAQTITVSCDDGNACTENDIEIRDACSPDEICVPCMGTLITPLLCDDLDCSNGIEFWDTETCSCITESTILGCTDNNACNYNPEATCSSDCDYSCEDCLGVPFGDWTFDECGECLSPTDPNRDLDCLTSIYVPNSFTPDNDGINDVFGIAYTGGFNSFQVEIFNRWGELIFFSTDPDFRWLGNMENGDYYVPIGVYTVRIEYSRADFKAESIIGSVSLIR
ncbi:MAG: gliding motility-associated C-terminal domain-containing protein [Flavobacteriales bacterium]